MVWDMMYNDKNWKEYRTKRSWLILRCYPSTAGYLADALQCRKKRGKFVRERGPNKKRKHTRFLQKYFGPQVSRHQATLRPL